MGQQQLLLIVLGTILVGIAVVVGISLFKESSVEANRDQLISDLTSLSANAQVYFKKNTQFGGGSGSYEGWDIPSFYKRYEGGRIRVNVQADKDKVVINGRGTEIGINGSTVVRVRSVIKPNSIALTIMN